MKKFLAVVLIAAMSLVGCSSSQFISVLQEITPAVTAILQIVALLENKPADTTLAAKVGSDVAGLEKLYTDFAGADAISKPGIQTQINAAFGVLNGDLDLIFNLAHVADKNTQAKLTALIALITTAVNIAEATINGAKAATPGGSLDASSLTDSFDKILVARTGNSAVDKLTPKLKLHRHSKFVRTLSLGLAN